MRSILLHDALAFALVIGGCARSEVRELPPGAMVLGESPAGTESNFALHALGGFLSAGYLFTRDESDDNVTTEHRLEERLGIGGVGSVVSPRFLTYDGVGVVGLTQDWVEDDSNSSSDTGELYEGDATVKFFPDRWHPLTIEFNRYDDYEPRVFFTLTETTTTSVSATQSLHFEDASLNLTYAHREHELKSSNGGARRTLADTTEDSVLLAGRYRISPRQDLDGRYVFRDVRQLTSQGDFSEHRLDADHRLSFGAAGNHELRSTLRGEYREGQFDQDSIGLQENLRYEFSEELKGRAGLGGEIGSREGNDREVLRGEASLTHRLFDSLMSSIGGRGAMFHEGESSTDQVGGFASLDYTKETPLGRLRLSYAVDLESRYIERGSGTRIDEVQTFPVTPPEEVRLDQPGADPATLVVTDVTGTIFFQEGIDYTVAQDSGGVTILTRIFTGVIPPGGTVLVDYVFDVGADYTQVNLGQTASLEHVFDNGLAPFVRYSRLDQTITDVDGFGAPQEIDEETILTGVEWRYSPYLLGVEYEHHDSTVDPFEAVRLRASGSQQIADRHRISATISQSWIFNDETASNPNGDRRQTIFRAITGWESRISSDLGFRIDAAFRWQDDSQVGVTTGFSGRGELRYDWRRFSVRLRAAYRDVRTEDSDFEGAEVSIWIVREFGDSTTAVRRAVNRLRR